jgi:GTP diphosphokinase / guanosine-3',5'-bis(diphosphate) 3'-diphosphatase
MDNVKLRSILKSGTYLTTEKYLRPDHILREVSKKLKPKNKKEYDKTMSNIQKAIFVASSAHEGVFRKNGEPYILHPYYVAFFLAKMGMDEDCIIAGLLHDTVEDTSTTVQEIENIFGSSVAKLVDGVTKLTELKLAKQEKQAIAFQKLITFAADDIRVIFIKLVDRLHNLMTLDAMPPEKQVSIANESLRFYAPLAHRLGIYWMKEEMEALAFYFSMREEWNDIDEFFNTKYPNVENTISDLIAKVGEAIETNSSEVSEHIHDIYGRAKSYFSIYKKTIRKGLEISSLHDILGIRVILDTNDKSECYLAMAAIHSFSEFTVVNKYFKDYISRPKENGYMSIHTVVRYKEYFIEIQIRTSEMDRVAREGNASHWAYKNDISSKDKVAKWLRNVLKDLIDSENPIDFMANIENALPLDTIAIFSPKGDIFPLPQGSTVLDFAYAVHGDIGDSCIGGIVNGKKVPISYHLKSKDEVVVDTSKNQTPRLDWLNFVKTPKAKQHIKRFLSKKEKLILEQKGREMVIPLFQSQGRAGDFDILKESTGFAKIADRYSLPKNNRMKVFFQKLALGEIKLRYVISHLFNQNEIEQLSKAFPQKIAPLFTSGKKKKEEKTDSGKSSESKSIFIKNIGEIKEYSIAKCCSPDEGDVVAAYISPTRGYILHKVNCPILKKSEKERIDESVYWYHSAQYLIEFIVVLKNTKGALLELVEELTTAGFNITSLHLSAEDAKEESGSVFVNVKGSNIKQIEVLNKNLKNRKSIIRLSITNIDY